MKSSIKIAGISPLNSRHNESRFSMPPEVDPIPWTAGSLLKVDSTGHV